MKMRIGFYNVELPSWAEEGDSKITIKFWNPDLAIICHPEHIPEVLDLRCPQNRWRQLSLSNPEDVPMFEEGRLVWC